MLAVDMDGTCLNDRKLISNRNMEALRKAADAGILVVPTTGRTVTCLPHQLKKENFYHYLISSNGAMATDLTSGKTLFEAKIPYGELSEFLKSADEIGLGVSAHIGGEFVLQGHALRALGKITYRKDAESTKCVKSIRKMVEDAKVDVEEIQLFHFSKEARQRTRELLDRYPQFTGAGTPVYVEVYAKNASKGAALAALAEQLGIAREEIACIGDAENDLSMFASSGLKFAMGNAIPELKERASAVVPDNNSDGVACAVEQYLLK